MVGNGSEGPVKRSMSPSTPKIEPERLGERLAALPGIDRLREAAAGLSAYLVGGAVRDLLLGRRRADMDVAVEGDVGRLAVRLGGKVRAHERFGTATVRIGELLVDLAQTRTETYPVPGALPEVTPASLDADLARRDFTVNAMAVALTGGTDLIDPHGGLDDLRRGELRVLHPGSFVDDPTRALRAARYATRYELSLEAETARLLHRADLSTVSRDRIEAELRKLADEQGARRGFELVAEWGLLDLEPAGPELAEAAAKLTAVEPWREVASRPDVVLAAALGRGVEGARELAAARPERPSQSVDLARGRTGVELALARALGAEWLDAYVARHRHVRLEVDGDDLIAAGIPEGPAIGRGLDAALRAKLDGEIEDASQELAAALAAARENECG